MPDLDGRYSRTPLGTEDKAERLAALDHLRGFIIGLVVLHHVVLAYCTFGRVSRISYALSTAPVVDAQRWIGFDAVVLLNDGFFMPLLFLLSGLFVWDGLARKGAAAFLRARLLRLGLPFAVAELTVVPLAYYPSFLQAGGAPGFARFWVATVGAGPWPSRPPWFIGVLLVLDGTAALAFILARGRGWTAPARCRHADPLTYFGLLLAASCLLYLPLLLAFGPTRWFSVGPLAVQGSRVGLYAAYFAAGVALGRGGTQAVARLGEAAARGWASWALLAVLTGLALLVVAVPRAGGPFGMPRWTALPATGMVRAGFCAAACVAVPALFVRFGGRRTPVRDGFAANGFAIYLLHYPFVTWTQYALLPASLGALPKGTVTLVVALAASWACADLLRRLPVIKTVL